MGNPGILFTVRIFWREGSCAAADTGCRQEFSELENPHDKVLSADLADLRISS